ncbi:DUF1446 domain containing protein [Hyaloscypha variabilis]
MVRRAIRIGNCSGAIGDGLDQLYRQAAGGPIDGITADYLAEFNLAWKAIEMIDNPQLGYEPGFLDQLAFKDGAAARLIAEKGLKVVHNGGALNPKGLAEKVNEFFVSLGITTCKTAWVSGDDVKPRLEDFKDKVFEHLDIKETALDKNEKIISATAYVGMAGIVAALENGADIVICGRCTDASPVMGLAAWWHGWDADDYQALSGSLIAGHLIECSAYVTGGNYCGWREIENRLQVGYPIAEIAWDGTSVITKHKGTNGAVTVDTCKAQLVYEIQGPYYLNPDVIAKIDLVSLREVGKDRVQVTGISGMAPPATTKLAICLHGGYQAEISAYFVGLDIDDKVAQLRAQLMGELDPSDYSALSIEPYGSHLVINPETQAEATVKVRIFAQAPTVAKLEKFKRAIFNNGMQGCCGFHMNMDWRTMVPKPFVKYFPTTIDQKLLSLAVHFIGKDAPTKVAPHGTYQNFQGQESYEPKNAKAFQQFGPTEKRPFGDIVFARSGDKGGNANVGFWVRNPEAWPWLQSFLDSATFIKLMGKDWKPAYRVERFEFPNLLAVHFVTYGILQEGVSSSSILDGFAKSFGEFIRARVVDVPQKLLDDETQRRAERIKTAGWLKL